MKSYHINLGAGLDGLVARDQEIPAPGPHEALVGIHAASLNRRDLMNLNHRQTPNDRDSSICSCR